MGTKDALAIAYAIKRRNDAGPVHKETSSAKPEPVTAGQYHCAMCGHEGAVETPSGAPTGAMPKASIAAKILARKKGLTEAQGEPEDLFEEELGAI